MAAIGVFLVLFIGTVFFVGIGTLIYYFIYRYIINQRLAQGITDKKGLLSPIWLAVILLGISMLCNLLFTAAFSLMLFKTDSGSVVVGESDYISAPDITFMNTDELDSGFSPENNADFRKEELTADYVTNTCFTAAETAQDAKPHYLLYSDFSGMPEDTVCLMEIRVVQVSDGMDAEDPLELPLLTDASIVVGEGNWELSEDRTLVTWIDGFTPEMNAAGHHLAVTTTLFSKVGSDFVYDYMNGGDIPEGCVLYENTVMFE